MTPSIPINHIPESISRFKPGERRIHMLTIAAGLESLAADEVAQKIKAEVIAMMRGKVFFIAPSPCTYTTLRCADNLYEFLCTGDLGHTRTALTGFNESLNASGFEPIAKEMRTSSKPVTFTVNAGITGKHTYSRFEAAAAFAATLESRYGFTPGENENRDIEFRLDILAGKFLLFKKLTNAAFRFRGNIRHFSKAALRPTVAHALVWASGLLEQEVFLDPFCGSGTLLCERAAYLYSALLGGDSSETAIIEAKANLCAAGLQPADRLHNESGKNKYLLYHSPIEVLPIEAQTVDNIVTNPPWGEQIPSDDLNGLYLSFLQKASIWLTPAGRLTVLTPLSEPLTRAAQRTNFSCEAIHTVSLHGKLCYIYQLHRR